MSPIGAVVFVIGVLAVLIGFFLAHRRYRFYHSLMKKWGEWFTYWELFIVSGIVLMIASLWL